MKLLRYSLLVLTVPGWTQMGWAQVTTTINELPSREFGHAQLSNPIKSLVPNLIEGRELNGPSAIAFDTSVTPPILYVADGLNSRVLAWRNPLGLTAGDPADKVIGQRDAFTAIPQGPGRSGSDLPTGLARPVALAVDSGGNLYVMDAANNRILRYPAPFNQTGDTLPVNLVIGQTSTTSGIQPNAGKPVNASTLSLNALAPLYVGGISFDAQGNLWATDVGNHRVLRYNRQLLTQTPAPIEPAADVVLGQKDFFSNVDPRNDSVNTQTTKTILIYPNSVTPDGNNGLYITDAFSRALFYSNPGPANSQPGSASRILGVLPPQTQGQSPLLYPNQYSLAGGNQNGQPTGYPLCAFTSRGSLFVCDSNAHRVVRYDPSQWAPETTQAPSPSIVSVIGQPDSANGCSGGRVKCTQPNRGLAEPDATTLTIPTAGSFDPAGNLWICDFGNHRVLFYPASDSFLYPTATKVLGQANSGAGNDAFNHNAPNLVEGRELWIYNGGPGGGMVVDKNSNPPHLYIADTFNNRILGFRDARVVGADARSTLTTKADLVIGQPDLYRTVVNCAVATLNGPCTSGSAQSPNDTGLFGPIGLAVDAQGNLYVADSGNGRVLRFPSPFSHSSEVQRANRVLGQTSFGQATLETGQRTMRYPYGLVVFTDGNLGVSDALDNRILIFRKAGGDFADGQLASAVVGQSGYSSAIAAAGPAGLRSPRHLAADDSDRLFIADSGNNRLMIFRSESSLGQGGDARAAEIDNLSQAVGVAVEPPPARGIWVASVDASTLYHLRDFDHLQNTQADITQAISSYPPITVTLDSFGNPIVAEFTNRVSFFFPKLAYRNAANATSGGQQQVSPGLMMYVATLGTDIVADATPVLDPPWPSTLSGLQVLVNGIPSPIFRVAPPYIYMVAPLGIPSSGVAEFLVTRPATGQILGAGTFSLAPSAPGFFTANSQGTSQIVAQNFADGSTNGPNHPVARGEILTLWLTGQGPGFQGTPPADGQGASGLFTDVKPVVYVNGSTPLPDANIIGSAMTVYPGVWVINIKIPSDPGPGCVTGPTCDIPIYIRMRDTYSYYGGTANGDQKLSGGLFTTFRLKQ